VTTDSIAYRINSATVEQVAQHLAQCDAYFVPILSGRVDLNVYAMKICSNAVRFEAWSDDLLVGLLAAYCNDPERRIAYITSVSILVDRTGKGIATRLLRCCVEYVKLHRLRRISLEVTRDHRPAIHLYEKCGFSVGETNGALITMNLDLEPWEAHEHQA
jgi:ribosomal protein S18 acetylase RimI-like enzyme